MKKFILLFTSATLLFAGCAKVENEEIVPEKGKHHVTLKASVVDGTRVAADASGAYSWQAGEQITVLGDDGLPVTFTSTSPAGTTADFDGEFEDGVDFGPYAFSPASDEHFYDIDENELLYNLSSYITYDPDVTNMPMMASVTSNGASFKAIGGVLKVIVYNVPSEAQEFHCTVYDREVTGCFTVTKDDQNNDVINTSVAQGGNDYFTVNLFKEEGGSTQSLWAKNMVFHIPLPVGTYNKFTFSFHKLYVEEALASKTATIVSGLQIHRNEIVVAPALNMAPPATTATLWSEDFGGYSASAVPSGEVAKGYNGANVSYTCVKDGTKIYNETNAGGTSPELLIASGSGSFTVSGIPTAGATSATLTFKENYNRTTVSSTTTGVTIGTGSFSNKVYTCTISFASGLETFDLVFTNSNSSNVRVDNFVVEATVGAPVVTPSISTQSESATISAGNLSASIDGVKLENALDDQGIVATTDVDWLTLEFEGSNGFDVGKKLKATAKSYNHDSSPRTATVTLKATGAANKIVTFVQNPTVVHNPTLTAAGEDENFTITWTGDEKAASYVGYYSTSELDDPTTGTSLSITADGSTYTAVPSQTVVNGTKYYVYVRVASIDAAYTDKYAIASGWSQTDVTPSATIDYTTTYTSDNVTLSAGSNASSAHVVINGTSYEAYKAGTSSGTGSNAIKITIPANTSILHIHIAGWSGDETTVSVSLGGGVTTSPSSFSPKEDTGVSGSGTSYTINDKDPSSFYKKITISTTAAFERELTISSSGKKERFVVWGVNAE